MIDRSRDIVWMHGGSIAVQHLESEDRRITIRLPARDWSTVAAEACYV